MDTLEELDLSHNALTTLPGEMAQLSRLHTLRLDSNQLARLPPWVYALPSLRELYLDGNPCADIQEKLAQICAQMKQQNPSCKIHPTCSQN